MAIEIVDFPIKNGDFPWQNVSSPEGSFQRIRFDLVDDSEMNREPGPDPNGPGHLFLTETMRENG